MWGENTMDILNQDSLAETLDAVNEALLQGRPPAKSQRAKTAKWLASRQGLPGSYAGMFAPTDADRANGIRLFTGERITTRAATGHILGEETCRALILLDVDSPGVRSALELATEGMTERLNEAKAWDAWRQRPGEYCCGPCTCSLWRHFAAGGLRGADPERWLAAGIKSLKKLRLKNSRWQRFPYHYTLLALSEIELPQAIAELRHAAPSIERLLRRKPKDDPYATRRRVLAERILGRC